jgi:hypothetical protein
MVPEVEAWAGFHANNTGGDTLGMHDRPSARAAFVVAADEFYSGELGAPGAATSPMLTPNF